MEHSDFETSSLYFIPEEVVDELTSADVLLDLFDKLNGVLAVASAATVLDLDKVVCFGVAEDFVRLR